MSRSYWASILLSVYLASTLVSMASMSIGLLFLVAAIFVARPDPHATRAWFYQSSWIRNYLILSGSLFLACVVSLLGATFMPVTIGGVSIHVQWPQDLMKAWYLLLPLLSLVALKSLDEIDRERPIRIWLCTAAVLCVVGFFQHFTGWPRPQLIPFDLHDRFHVTLFLGHHLTVASVFIFPVFFSLDRFWTLRKEKNSFLYGVLFLFGAIALILTFARSAWVSLPFGVLVWVCLRFSRKVLLASVLVVALVAGVLYMKSEGVRRRIEMSQYIGISERYDLWEANYDFFKMRPLTGLGWRKASDLSGPYLQQKYPDRKEVFAGHAHNNFIEMASSTGLFGLAAWLGWCGYIFFSLLRLARKTKAPGAGGLVAAWAAFHVNGLTQVNFWEGKVIHQLMWATALGGFLILSQKSEVLPKVSTVDPRAQT